MIILIILGLMIGLGALFLFDKGRGRGFVEREVISEKEYLAQLRADAKLMRCPHPNYRGHRPACGRAARRPCVRGCTGRTDLSTDWQG